MSLDHAHAHVNLCLCRLHQGQFRITTCTNQKQHGINIPIANELNACVPLQAEAVIAAAEVGNAQGKVRPFSVEQKRAPGPPVARIVAEPEGGNTDRNLRSSVVRQKREAGPPVTRIQEADAAHAQPLLTEDALMTSCDHIPLVPTDAPGSPEPTMEVRYVVFRSCPCSC